MLVKIVSILKKWQKRGLSLIGKILIINALIASLFVHKMQVLPFLPETYIVKIEKEFENFIWNGKKPKIPIKTLQVLKQEGGLKLVNLRNKDKAIKVSWVQRLEHNDKLACLAYEYLHPLLREKIWQTNLSKEDAQKLFVGNNKFWNHVMYAWCELNWEPFKKNYLIWYNLEIRIDNLPIYWEKQCKKGLMYVYQLYENDKIISCIRAQEMYQLDIMSYNALISVIPKYLKQDFGINEENICISVGKAYSTLCQNQNPFWEKELEICIPSGKFVAYFKSVYVITNVTKLRSFQYRLLHRAIVTNSQLYHWKIKSSNLCSFCNLQKESYTHMFCQCYIVKTLWDKIVTFCFDKFKVRVAITPRNVIFNTIDGNNPKKICNLICLLTKHYIYTSRCLEQEITFGQLKEIITHHENMEKYIATKNGKLHKHIKKWCRLSPPESALSAKNKQEFLRMYVDMLE